MANDFLTNLRAARSGANNRVQGNTLPTRGDMQKQRRGKVDPNSFYNFLRMLPGTIEVPKGEERLNIKDVPASNVDRMSPEAEAEFNENEKQRRWAADQGTLNAEDNLEKANAAWNGSLQVEPGQSSFDNSLAILDNYDALEDILDQYDKKNTWTEKKAYLKNAYPKFKDNSGDIGRWFSLLYDNTSRAQAFGETNTKNVSDIMRGLNERVRRLLLKRS